MRVSGMQAEVRSLYRQLLRAANKKGGTVLTHKVSVAFKEKAASAQRNDFKLIEHLLRYGHKQKKLLEMPGFRSAEFASNTSIKET